MRRPDELALALLLIVVGASTATQPWPLGWTTNGAAHVALEDGTIIAGASVVNELGHSANAFLGIPYASAPVGSLRWQEPQPYAGFGPGRTINATEFGSACPQLASTLNPVSSTDEDCLFVNVYTPPTSFPGPSPVMVFVHGGLFVGGSGSLPYSGLRLAAREGVIVVTLNYRLGPLGFLALEALRDESPVASTGNYGLQDQRAALAWVRQNIGAFGGNTSLVTLFGESAGAASVWVHYVSPLSAGLFQRVIMESAGCNRTLTLGQAYAVGDATADVLGCSSSSSNEALLACMRNASVTALLTALPIAPLGSSAGASYGPVVDGYELTASPNTLLASGKLPSLDVPVMLGTNLNEMTLFVMTNASEAHMDAAELVSLVHAQFGPAAAPAILEHYPPSEFSIDPAAEAWAAMLTDVVIVCPVWFAAGALAQLGVPVLRYRFVYVPQCGLFPPALAPLFGVYHFAEIAYVFGVAPTTCNFTADDTIIMNEFELLWASWAHGLAPWPDYRSNDGLTLAINVTSSYEFDVDAKDCEFWETII